MLRPRRTNETRPARLTIAGIELSVGFFGREIADILSVPEARRSERHESARSWLKRLAASGFDVRVDGEPPHTDAAPAVRLARHAYHVSIDAADEPVVSVFTARR